MTIQNHSLKTGVFGLLVICSSLVACGQIATAPDGAQVATQTKLPQGQHANPEFEGVRHMMRAKLAHAQAVLEGIATNRLDMVQTNANALVNLSELSEWQVHRTMEYGMYSDDFRGNARELSRHAKEGKLHAATLDYMQLTMTCIRCHDYMNRAGLVQVDLKSLLVQKP